MKPVDFDYAAPTTVPEVLDLLETWQGDAKLLAGGQSLVPLLVTRALRPRFVIDINRVEHLDYIRSADGELCIGATARQTAAHESELLARHCPLLREAVGWVATPQVRNRGTLVGSLTQRNAISQIPTAALALGARLKVLNRNRAERLVDAATFVDPANADTLGVTDFVVEARFPFQAPEASYAFVETQRRQAHYATVSVAVVFATGSDGKINHCRVAASGVARCVRRLTSIEGGLLGRLPQAETFREAAAAGFQDPAVQPMTDLFATEEYRREVLPALVEEALTKAANRPLLQP